MKAKTWVIFLVLALMLVGTVSAAGLSIQLKRTNPGVAKVKSSEIIFDVVNTDLTHKVEGFLWCRSPDDAVVSGVEGVGSGSGAQYVGPKFVMDVGPSQRAMSLTLEADSVGDKRTGCTIKYAPFKETVIETSSQTEKITYEGTITTSLQDIAPGYTVSLESYTPAVEATNETPAAASKANIKVNQEATDIEVGKSVKIGDLTIKVKDANAENATISVIGTKTVVADGSTKVQYLKMNGVYVDTLTDDQYREIRLDKTIPFVADMSNPQCPEDKKASCKADEVVDLGGLNLKGNYLYWIIGGVVLVILLVVYLLGRTSKD